MDLEAGAAWAAVLLGEAKQQRHAETTRCLLRLVGPALCKRAVRAAAHQSDSDRTGRRTRAPANFRASQNRPPRSPGLMLDHRPATSGRFWFATNSEALCGATPPEQTRGQVTPIVAARSALGRLRRARALRARRSRRDGSFAAHSRRLAPVGRPSSRSCAPVVLASAPYG